ncbi:MAG: aminotransferase class V-fold PLP-dependent enzyme [Rhizobiaceae bacterium]|nr:aminotransferase class V-fold PLP-dependent enzyme [Rhizobiaceae bacterium]
MSNAAFPELGRAIRKEWALDWTKLTVNHGAYGATPKRVLAAQDVWRSRMEAQPSTFMRMILPDALRQSAAALGAFVGANGDDIVFLDNATTGCNAVLRSLAFAPGDEIILLSETYGAVANTTRFVCGLSGARIVEVPLPFPTSDVSGLTGRIAAALTNRTRLVVVDHVTSPSALVLPIADIVRVCHAAGAAVLVDGAHGPAQVDVDLTALDADWYVGNCHKWLMAPKGCAFLWARPDRQDDLHPVTISHGYGTGFLGEFGWTGTRDPSAWLAVDAAIDFHHELGGAQLRARNAALVREGADYLAERLGTVVGGPRLGAAMAMVLLPVGGPFTKPRAVRMRGRLLEEFGTDAPLMPHSDGIWVRLSAHAYNAFEDYEMLADICLKLAETEKERGEL